MKTGILAAFAILLIASVGLNIHMMLQNRAVLQPAQVDAQGKADAVVYRSFGEPPAFPSTTNQSNQQAEGIPRKLLTEESPPTSGLLGGRPTLTDDGQGFWIQNRVERSDFHLKHGLEPEEVSIPNPPKTPSDLKKALIGTMWSWATSADNDKEWVIFLDDGTMYGSWGMRYAYDIDPDTMEVVWAEHRTAFTDGLEFMQTTGRNDRIGMLLRRAEGDALNEFMERAGEVDVVEQGGDSVPWTQKK